ncbi:MAG: YlbF family regulator [Candidatus Glassbacteria bacterium]|nr:YlbF family regulator [Candidatus Glassbacteria bacterium]
MDIETSARQLGRQISQTPEYKHYDQATKDVNEDREVSGMMEKLREYENKVAQMVRAGETMTEEFKKEYSEYMEQVQSKTQIQSLIASQENYLKLMNRVNEMIAEGIREGPASRIITDF